MSLVTKSGHRVLFSSSDANIILRHVWSIQKNASGTCYAKAKIDGHSILMHRLILGLTVGDLRQCDHVNHDGLDNRRSNIRICNRSQNQANKRPMGGSSKFKGVFWHKKANKWAACISHKGRSIYLGIHSDEVAAAKRYDEACLNIFGEFACTNASLGLITP